MKKKSLIIPHLLFFCCISSFQADAQSFVEEFDVIDSLFSHGWDSTNHSTEVGPTSWFQGIGTFPSDKFPAYSGIDSNSYVAADLNNSASLPNATISNWLFAPLCTFNNGDEIHFYTRKTDSIPTLYPDRLQLRLSTSGSSINVGTLPLDTGDYSTLLIDINPTYSIVGYPTGYPYTWTHFVAVLSGLSGPTSGRFAFRYFVTDGGPQGNNSYYIGIDSVAYVSTINGIHEINKNLKIGIYPNPSSGVFKIQVDLKKSQEAWLDIANEFGQLVYQKRYNMDAGMNEQRLDLSALANGVYSLLIRTGDVSYHQKLVIRK